MVTAFVMMETDPHPIPESAQDIANIDEVQAVYTLTRRWDLVAMVKTPNLEDLSDLVPAKIAQVATVHDTETMFAFRTYSDQELEASFSLGGE